jgi:hypothetical protein
MGKKQENGVSWHFRRTFLADIYIYIERERERDCEKPWKIAVEKSVSCRRFLPNTRQNVCPVQHWICWGLSLRNCSFCRQMNFFHGDSCHIKLSFPWRHATLPLGLAVCGSRLSAPTTKKCNRNRCVRMWWQTWEDVIETYAVTLFLTL